MSGEFFTKLLDQTLRDAPRLLTALLLFLVAWALSRVVRRAIARVGRNFEEPRKRITSLFASIGANAIIFLGALSSLGAAGIDVSALVAGLGLTGFALGFALKDALSNALSGALLLVYQPFRYGDYVKVSDCEGEVVEINLRYTVLRSNGQKYLVPNATLFNNSVRVAEKPAIVDVDKKIAAGR